VNNARLDYLWRLFRLTFGRYPVLYGCIALYAASSVLEVLAMSAFIPLSESAAGRTPSPNNVILRLLRSVGASTEREYIFLAYTVLFSLRIIAQIIAERLLMYVTYYRVPAQFMKQGLSNILERYNISDIERTSTGKLTMLAGEEVHKAAFMVATSIRFMSTFVLIGAYYAMIAAFSPQTALGVIAFLAVSAVSSYGILRRVHRLGVIIAESSRTATSIFIDAINGVRSVRAFGAQRYVLRQFETQMFQHKQRLFQVEFFNFFGRMMPMLLLVIVFGVYILVGTHLSRAAFDYAFAVTLLLFLLRFFLSVGDAVNVFLKIVADAKSAQDITSVVDDVVDNHSTDNTPTLPEPTSARAHEQQLIHGIERPLHTQQIEEIGNIERIELLNVSFGYDRHELVLERFSAVFERGSSYAIVGESGAGKSTLLDILLGFQTPQSGVVSINGIELSRYNEQAMRRRLIVLGQETIIFDDTVRNNITYGIKAEQSEIDEAARLACIHDVIAALPQSYDTRLQYRGTNLSGGQRQRIGIARALLRKPDVLVLDESMSALDPQTKEQVTENILREYRDKIVIIVSHDPALRTNVDTVIELRKRSAHSTHSSESSSESKKENEEEFIHHKADTAASSFVPANI
jgi:ABC-type multidrug transport system fused ATPase/permease subunit